MPRKSLTGRAAYQREYRARQREAKHPHLDGMAPGPGLPADPAQAIADWSTECLIVPPGHPRAGEPMTLPDYGVDFLRDVFDPRYSEISLLIARKNSKSGVAAVMLLAHLIGPVRSLGFRAGIVSVSKEKANELKMQMEAIAEASKLRGLTFRRSPAPGRVESRFGSVDILSTESGGMASGFDIACADELGLFQPRDRELVNSMRSSVSARGGRFVSLSVIGDSPFVKEILDRKDKDPHLSVHLFQAREGCALDSEEDWLLANPGLACGIKQRSYFIAESTRVSFSTADQSSFRALDLNLPATPGTEMICSLSDWSKCETPDPPAPSKRCWIGLDMGGSASMSCVAAWFDNGLLKVWGAFPRIPSLKQRARQDSANYGVMAQRGELLTFGERTTDALALIKHVHRELGPGVKVVGAAADSFRRSEVEDAIAAAECRWPMEFRRVGSGPDGHQDVAAFQRAVLDAKFRTKPSLLLVSSIVNSAVRRDGNGNASLDKRKANGRIDPMQASIICAGLVERAANKPTRKFASASISLEEMAAL